MKKIKHLMISVLVLLMFFAIGAVNAGAKSVISVSNEKEAADMLRSLGIVDLGSDLASEMTVQDFIAAVSGMTGMDTAVVADTYFDDSVSTKDSVTVSKMCEVIISILNREMFAIDGGYEKAASDMDMMRKVVYGSNNLITRGNAAIMICNSLELEIYENNTLEYVKTNDTILSKYLKIEIFKGVINNYDDKRKRVYITVTGQDSSSAYSVREGLNMADAVNTTAYIYYNTEDNVVVNYDIYGDYTVIYDYIVEVNEYDDNSSYAAEDIKSIYLNKMDKKYKVNTERELTVIFNEELVTDPVPLNYTFARVVLYQNTVIAIKAYKLTEGGLITSKDTQALFYKQEAIKSIRDIEDYDDIEVIINYKSSLYSNLNADMIFDYWESDDKLYIVASNAVLTGNLKSYASDSIMLDNTRYHAGMLSTGEMYVSRNMGYSYSKTSNLSALLNQNVNVYFDSAGNARYIRNLTTSANRFFGVITKIEMDYETDYENMKVTVFGNIGGTPQSKKYKLKLNRGSGVTPDEIYNTYRTAKSNSIYRFYVNDDNEITKVDTIGVDDSSDLYYVQTGSKNPSDRSSFDSDLTEFFKAYDGELMYKGINVSELMFCGGGMINFNGGFGVMYVNSIDRPTDYVAYDVTNTECLSIWNKDGEVKPTYFDWGTLRNYQNRRNNLAIKIVFDKELDEYNPALIIMMNDSDFINNSTQRRYGLITKIETTSYNDERYYRVTVKDYEHKEASYIIDENSFLEDEAWGNGMQRMPMVGDLAIYTVGGQFEYTVVRNENYLGETNNKDDADSEDSESDEEEEEEYEYIETIVSEDGTANILKVIRASEDLENAASTRYYETNVRLTVVDSLYDMNTNILMTKENGKILSVQRASGGIVGFPTDRTRSMIIMQGDMNKDFEYSAIEDMKTERAYGVGDKLYILSDGDDIKAVIVAE